MMNETIENKTISPYSTLVEVEVLAYMKLSCAAIGMVFNIITLVISLFLFLFLLWFNVPVNNFSVMLRRSHLFLGITSTFGE